LFAAKASGPLLPYFTGRVLQFRMYAGDVRPSAGLAVPTANLVVGWL